MLIHILCFFTGSALGTLATLFFVGARTLELEQEAYLKGLEDRGHF